VLLPTRLGILCATLAEGLELRSPPRLRAEGLNEVTGASEFGPWGLTGDAGRVMTTLIYAVLRLVSAWVTRSSRAMQL
jgi:hypothetical protein